MSEFPYKEPHPMGGTDGEPEPRVDICPICHRDRNAIKEMITQGGRHNMTIVCVALENCLSCKKAIEGRS